MTGSGPDTHHDPGAEPRGADHDRPRGHTLMMAACCIPMLVIAGVLVATGVAGFGAVVAAIICVGGMAAMMFMMPRGRS